MTKPPFQNIGVLLFLSLLNTFSFGQSPGRLRVTDRADGLKQDFSVFRNTLEDNYPSLYRYNSKEKIKSLFDSCYASININTSEAGLFSMLKFICSSIQDGHLYCGPSQQLRIYNSEKAMLFPLRLYFVGEQAFVSSNSNDSVPAGTEIMTIDGRSIKQVRTDLFKLMVSDGSIETKKYHIINSAFSFYYFMVYGEQAVYNIMTKSDERVVKTIKLSGVKSKDIPGAGPDETGELIKLSFRDDVAIITIKTFDSEKLIDKREYFSSFLEGAFQTINEKKIKKLIIDLRDNGGGRGLYGSLLYSYLTNKAFDYYKSLTAATTDLPYEKFNINSTSFNDLNASMLINSGDKRFQLKQAANDNLLTVLPNKNNYKGKVWFLINGSSFSTTAEFCAIAKSNKRGKFIGEETGGSYYGNTSGVMVDSILPNTNISFSFGLIEYEMAVVKTKFKDRGILPDYNVIPGIADIIDRKDVQLEYALNLAKSK